MACVLIVTSMFGKRIASVLFPVLLSFGIWKWFHRLVECPAPLFICFMQILSIIYLLTKERIFDIVYRRPIISLLLCEIVGYGRF